MGNNIQATIRKARLEDVKAIAVLHKKVVHEVNSKHYSTEASREWIKDISEENVKCQFQNSNWIVAEASNKLVGFGQYSVVDGEIYQINVSPDFLNQNIGKKLYDYMENDFVSNGAEKISLNSTLNAVGFYQKLEFKMLEETYIGSIKMLKMESSCGAINNQATFRNPGFVEGQKVPLGVREKKKPLRTRGEKKRFEVIDLSIVEPNFIGKRKKETM